MRRVKTLILFAWLTLAFAAGAQAPDIDSAPRIYVNEVTETLLSPEERAEVAAVRKELATYSAIVLEHTIFLPPTGAILDLPSADGNRVAVKLAPPRDAAGVMAWDVKSAHPSEGKDYGGTITAAASDPLSVGEPLEINDTVVWMAGVTEFRKMRSSKRMLLIIVDQGKFRDEPSAPQAPASPAVHQSTAPELPNGDAIIEILIAYTKAGMGGRTLKQFEQFVKSAITISNESFRRSNVRIHLWQVGSLVELNFTGTGDYERDVSALRVRQGADPSVVALHKARDDAAADIVVLFTGPDKFAPTSCGHVGSRGIGVGAEDAYAIVWGSERCATANLSLAHEIGHLFGARHSSDPDTHPYPHGRGAAWTCNFPEPNSRNDMNKNMCRDVMADACAGGPVPSANACIRMPNWGRASAQSNVVKLLNDRAVEVSRFR